MIWTITYVLAILVAINFLLLFFSINKTKAKTKVSHPPLIIKTAASTKSKELETFVILEN